MLYLLCAGGQVEEVPQAHCAHLDEEQGTLLCYDEQGQEVACRRKQEVTLVSTKPFPIKTNEESPEDLPKTLSLLMARRTRLLEQFDEGRARIDTLLQAVDAEPAMRDIALLEGLLTARRDLLGQLVGLDDEIISHLLELRARNADKAN